MRETSHEEPHLAPRTRRTNRGQPPFIRETERELAEACLTICLCLPGVDEGSKYELYLTRQPKVTRWTLESRSVDEDGTLRETWRMDTEIIHGSVELSGGVGWSLRKDVRLRGLHHDAASIEIDVEWVKPDGSGAFRRVIEVPWMGSIQKEFGQGRWVAAAMTVIEQPITPDATRGTQD